MTMAAPDTANPFQPTVDFLRLFHPGDWLLHAIPRVGEGFRSERFPLGPRQTRDALSWAKARNEAVCDIYFAVNPTRASLIDKASKDDVLEASCVWVDCDPAKTMDDAAVAAWRTAKLLELRTHPTIPPPSTLVDSGRGLWAYWRLATPAPIDGRGPNTVHVESVLAGLVEAFDGDGNAKNIDRIARLPGFINHKTGRTGFVIECDPARSFTLDQFPASTMVKPDGFTGPQPYEAYIDDQEACDAVRAYLGYDAPAAIADGAKGGRTVSIQVLQRCLDLGCSPGRAAELMAESGWNERCDPPWDQEVLEHELRKLPRDKPIGVAHPTVLVLGLEGLRVAAEFFEPVPDEPTPSGNLRGFKTAEQFTNEFVPLSYALEGIIRSNSLYTLTARTGSGKTAFNVMLALAVATGRNDIVGREVTPGRVCYVACENADDVRMRILASAFRLNVDLKVLGDRLLILDRIMKPEVIARELVELARGAPFGLVIVDTLAALFDGTDFNSNAEGVKFMRRLRLLSRAEGNPTVLVSAHPGKNAAANALMPYGAGAITNEVDGNLTLAKDAESDEKDAPVSLHWQEKIRGVDFAPVEFRFESVVTPRVVDVKGRAVALPVLRPAGGAAGSGETPAPVVDGPAEPSIETRLLLAIHEAPRRSERAYGDKLGQPRSTIGRRLAKLSAEKLVTQAMGGWQLTTKGLKLANELLAELSPVKRGLEDFF